MTDRQIVTMAKLLTVIEAEFSDSLGRSATGYMPGVRLRARPGEPNWAAEIGGEIGIFVYGAFLVSIGRVQAAYDLDADDRERLISGAR